MFGPNPDICLGPECLVPNTWSAEIDSVTFLMDPEWLWDAPCWSVPGGAGQARLPFTEEELLPVPQSLRRLERVYVRSFLFPISYPSSKEGRRGADSEIPC